MNIFKRLFAARSESSFKKYIDNFLSGKSLSGSGGASVGTDDAMRYTGVWACLRVLAETFNSAPLFEYKKVMRNGQMERDRTNDTGLFDILHNAPNVEMDTFTYNELGMNTLNSNGNFVSQILRNRAGGIVGLFPYQADRVEIKRDKDTQEIIYVIDGQADKIRKQNQVLHLKGPTMNGFTGLSPIDYALKAISLGLTYEEFSINYFKNGVLSSGVFEHPQELSDNAYKRLKTDLDLNYAGLKNTGKPILLEDGMQFKELVFKLAEAELLSSKKFQIEDICRIYRVPLHLVQNLDRATNNNIEHQSLEFVMYTMLPWFKRWESAINNQLLTRQQRDAGYFFEYNMAGLLRGDQKSMAEAFATGRQWGWLSVNDIRRLMNLNGIGSAGDIYLQPMNMIQAGTEVDTQLKAMTDEIYNLISKQKRGL